MASVRNVYVPVVLCGFTFVTLPFRTFGKSEQLIAAIIKHTFHKSDKMERPIEHDEASQVKAHLIIEQ